MPAHVQGIRQGSINIWSSTAESSDLVQDKVSKHTEKLLVKQLRSPSHSVIKMAFIKVETEDMKVEEIIIVKQEDTEEQTGGLIEAFVYMFVQDSQPFTIVEDVGFKHFVGLLDPTYFLLSRQTLKTKITEEKGHVHCS
ncbi:hypothetical protein DPX16_3491 [Anabarilius grahami]|uniref:Uncharacterized protein n=1 Tax=Anabarilius grahami TaxID=495550 RepID=A0A3N0Y6Q2_ANAGA|nr:hypothetical protein DPX16_3491 [Anabarilius grahami]